MLIDRLDIFNIGIIFMGMRFQHVILGGVLFYNALFFNKNYNMKCLFWC